MKANDIRKGIVVMYEGNPCRVMDFQHRTPGNLRAFVQVRMRNLSSGNSFETRFSSTEDLETARLDTREMQVLYDDGTDVHVMDAHTYDQYTLDSEVVGELRRFRERMSALRDRLDAYNREHEGPERAGPPLRVDAYYGQSVVEEDEAERHGDDE